jgi:hypothetical protein
MVLAGHQIQYEIGMNDPEGNNLVYSMISTPPSFVTLSGSTFTFNPGYSVAA